MKDIDQHLIWEAYDDEIPLGLGDIMKRYGYSKAAWEDLWKRKTYTAKWGDVGVESLDIEVSPKDDMDIDLYFSWLHTDQMIEILYKIHGGDEPGQGDQIYKYIKNNFIGAAHDILDGPVEAIFKVKPESGVLHADAPWLKTGEGKPTVLLNDFQSDYVTIQTPIPRGLQMLSTTPNWEKVNKLVNTRFDQMILLRDAVVGPNANWEGF